MIPSHSVFSEDGLPVFSGALMFDLFSGGAMNSDLRGSCVLFSAPLPFMQTNWISVICFLFVSSGSQSED